MRIVGDKATLLALAVGLLFVFSHVSAAAVTWLLSSLILSALWGAPNRGRMSILVPAGAISVIALVLIALPVSAPLAPTSALMMASTFAAYDLAYWAQGLGGGKWAFALVGAPVIAALTRPAEDASVLLAAAGVGVAVLLARRTRDADDSAERLSRMRDDLGIKVRALEDTNARLAEALDYEPRAAALAERTRIARDIHDTVGHLLTRGVFQLNALHVVHADDETLSSGLRALGQTLDEAMTSMRASVHALADESEDVETTINAIAARSSIPHTSVDCRIDDAPPSQVSRTIVALTREALTNAERHGRATSARVRVTEYPAFWQVAIDNDGDAPAWRDEAGLILAEEEGLGLRSMRTRVEALGGRLRINARPRFTVFATIPKEAR